VALRENSREHVGTRKRDKRVCASPSGWYGQITPRATEKPKGVTGLWLVRETSLSEANCDYAQPPCRFYLSC
jgi:hypothetical protein